jgi:hypothetical protein
MKSTPDLRNISCYNQFNYLQYLSNGKKNVIVLFYLFMLIYIFLFVVHEYPKTYSHTFF